MVTHIGTQRLETERLILRRFVPEDTETVYKNWANNPEVTRFLRWRAHTSIEQTHEMVARWMKAYESDEKYHWGIEVKGGELVGSIAVGVDNRDDRGETGYCIGRAFWGNGYTGEALRAVIDFMFERVGLNRIEAHHSVRNPSSGRVMEKAGMWLEGRPRQQYRSADGFEDCCLYGITREIWEMQREIVAYRALNSTFEDFIESGELSDGEIELVCTLKTPAIPEKKWVPSYTFEIRKHGARVGETNLRIGYTDSLYFGGHIGYHIDEAFRGNGYAGKACRLLIPVMRAHGMDTAIITNEVNNSASRRVCEKLGARLVRRAELPQWHDLYRAGERFLNVYEWKFAICEQGDATEMREIQREIAYYNALSVIFEDFIDPAGLSDGEIELVCVEKSPAIPEGKYVPAYSFEIRKDDVRVGHVGLRVGYTDGLYYGGQIGYGVDEAFRGHGFAGRACRLLTPVMRAHGMNTALITNDVNNLASRRVCEKLGARLVRKAELPEWHDLYEDGVRYVNVFEWRFE